MPPKWDSRWQRTGEGTYIRATSGAQLYGQTETGATAAAIKAAEELGVDITTVEGTGKDGKVTIGDVKAAAE